MRRISVFGSTGSIGQNTLDLLRRDREQFSVVALSGGRNVAQMVRDATEFRPEVVVTAFDDCYQDLKDGLAGTGIEVAVGADAIVEAAQRPADLAMSSIVGAAGLGASLAILEQGADLALANKESMVAAGSLVKATAAKTGGAILPVDSEHSAIFQALIGEDRRHVEQVVITASGGAFRDWTLEQMAQATPEQAATHPNWDMGQRITIDSASLFNKSLEVIEAKELFDLSPNEIDVVVHPQSYVHALVGFVDGAFMAHLGAPDMRHAIGFALYYPNRTALPVERISLAKIGSLTFSAPDLDKYKSLKLAYDVMRVGGLSGAIYNAAKEAALDAFIDRKIGFLDMAHVVEDVLEDLCVRNSAAAQDQTLDNILSVDQMARVAARSLIARKYTP